MRQLHRYWIEFETDLQRFGYFPSCVGLSAYDRDDAFMLVKRWVVRGDSPELPRITRFIEDADRSELIPVGERLPQQVGCSVWRGVWYPAINLYFGPDRES